MTTEKNISQLPSATGVNASDFIHLSQGGVDKKIPATDMSASFTAGQVNDPVIKEESSTSRTLTLADSYAYIQCTNGTLTTVTVLTGVFKIGNFVTLRNDNGGGVTLAAGAGVTISGSSSGLTLSEDKQVGTLLCTGVDTFDFMTGGSASTSIQGAITFPDVATMISGDTLEGGTIADWSGYVGWQVQTVVHNTTSKAGGAVYMIKTVAQAAADGNVIDGTGAPNYYGANHTLTGGTHVAILQPKSGSVGFFEFGAVSGSASYQHVPIQLCIEYAKYRKLKIIYSGFFKVGSTLNCVCPSTESIRIEGVSIQAARITTDLDIKVFEYAYNFHASNFRVTQEVPFQGVAFGTNYTNGQATRCSFSDLYVDKFDFSWAHRTTLFCTWKNITTVGLVGVRFMRNSDLYDQTDPNSPSGWNVFSPTVGWFHNAGSFDNCEFRDKEAGFWGCPTAFEFRDCTPELNIEDGTTNKLTPVGTVGTGVWLQAGQDGSRAAITTNKISAMYVEQSKRGIFVQDHNSLIVDGFVMQGGAALTPARTMIELDNSNATIQGFVSQDFFDYRAVISNNSTLRGKSAGTFNYLTDATSVQYITQNGTEAVGQYKVVRAYRFTGSVTGVGNQYDTGVDFNGGYSVHINGVNDGSLPVGPCYVGFKNGAGNNLDLVSGTEGRIKAIFAGGNIIIESTATTATTFDVTIFDNSTPFDDLE